MAKETSLLSVHINRSVRLRLLLVRLRRAWPHRGFVYDDRRRIQTGQASGACGSLACPDFGSTIDTGHLIAIFTLLADMPSTISSTSTSPLPIRLRGIIALS